MAETVVNFVLGKLGEMIMKEAQFLGEVKNKMKWVETELIRIKCYLTDADNKRRKGDARAENHLNELRDVAYRIEDAIDNFYLEIKENLEGNSRNDHGCLGKLLKRLGRKTTKLPALHNLGMELDDIKNVLEGISKSKVDYQIDPLQEKGKGETVLMFSRRATCHDLDEAEVVGLETDMNNIRKILLDPKTRRRTVVTIVGPGGLGKTTLAQLVYKNVQDDFELHIMVSVSQHYDPTDLLRKMITKLKNSEPTTQDFVDLISELKSLLRSKRYLIILDDVWGTDLWNQLKHALPDAKNGSRVLITSRLIEIAQSADPKMVPYELDFLNDEDSRDLLIKKARPYQNPGEKFPDNLLELTYKLSKKCMGLPLALIVLGGILSTKDTYAAWANQLRTMDWHSNGKDFIDILAMSYEDMPCYLKTCFLYLAFLPENFEISAPCLIRMWVAEGFMPQQGSKTMEELAEDCLEQLFQRSMVQVLRRDANGSIEYFRVHDLLRDFAMRQAGKENFITTLANPQNINHCNRAARRASLQACGPQFMEYVGPKIRSLFLFRLESNLPNYSEFRLLRVLEIVFVRTHEVINLRGVDRLIHLKYLGVRGTGHCTKLDMSEFSFRCLKNLETLDIQKTTANIPTDLWTINTLRHVIHDSWLPEIPSTAELRNLQTLEWIPIKNKIIPDLNKLQKLGLRYNQWSSDVDHRFGGLSSLTSLAIKGKNFPMEIVYPKGLPNYQNLQILHLDGNWSQSVTLEAKLFPKNLVKLTLQDSHLGQDPMPELGKLNSLKELRLITCVNNVKQMICPAGFPVLEKLHIWCLSAVRKLTVAQGVMPKLKHISTFPTKCEMPLELMHLIQEREKSYDPIRILLSGEPGFKNSDDFDFDEFESDQNRLESERVRRKRAESERVRRKRVELDGRNVTKSERTCQNRPESDGPGRAGILKVGRFQRH